ncbi:MAG: hypothetical protein R2752_09480 [Vicinamibacterales bacterium]
MSGSARFLRACAIAAVAAATVAGAAPSAAAQPVADGRRVLVMPFGVEVDAEAPGGAGAALWLGEAAALLVAEDLSAHGVNALTRDARVAAFDTLQLPMSASLTRATMIRVGELIGATEIVYGDLRLGSRLSVAARVIQMAPGRQTPDVTDEAALPDLFNVFDRVAHRLVGDPGAATEATRGDPDLPLEVFESYVKGLVAASPAVKRRFLETAMSQAPHDARILMALWSVYTAAGEHETALAVASAVPAESPRSRRARFAAAQSLLELRRYDGAHAALEALERERSDAAIANALGVVQIRRESLPDGEPTASAYFTEAVRGRPTDTDILFNLGYAHARAGAGGEALKALREAVRLDAADGDAHLVMSAVLLHDGRRAEAQREFELARLLGTSLEPAALTLTPEVPRGLERLASRADVFDVLGPDTPPAPGRTANATAPDGPPSPLALAGQRDQQEAADYHLEQGRRLFEARRDREAMEALRRAAYLTPYADEPHLLMGRLHRRAGRTAQAIDEFKVALWCRDSAAGHAFLADALLVAGQRDEARAEAGRALQLDPASAVARAVIARLDGGVPSRTGPVLPSERSR